jgi:hypothetical protein
VVRVFEAQAQKKPVLLFSNDADLLGGMQINKRQQDFKVYLTGVNTETQPYKFKFLSIGTARDGSKHSQAAIFDVAGLYRMAVDLPVPPGPQRDVPALFIGAGDVQYSGSNRVSSAYINGNWGGNPPITDKDFVVTGNLELSGDDINIGGTTCVGKNLSIQNQREGKVIHDVYVGGNITGAGGGFDNLFVEGNLNQGNAAVLINKNLTVNGDINTDLGGGSFYFTVNGNLVMGNGQLNFNGDNADFTVMDSVWIPNANGIPGNMGNNANRRILGSAYNSLLAVQNLESTTCTNNCKQENSNTVFSTGAANGRKIADLNSNADKKPAGADTAKNYCYEIWDVKIGCDGQPTVVVEDLIKTAPLMILEEYAANGKCNGINSPEHRYADNNNDSFINALNACAGNKSILYNDFLVVKVEGNSNANFAAPLDGNFIFIFDQKAWGSQFRLPPTTGASKVLMYLKGGIDGMIMPSVCNTSVGYNYFIYVLEGFPQANGFTSNCPMNGTVYMPQVNPITGEMNCNSSSTQLQGQANMIQNEELLEALFDAGVICDYEGGECQPGGATDPNDPEPPPPPGFISDVSYVPAVPHLRVALQSQYASEENSDNSINAEPAILVMPRIIYVQPGEINSTSELTQYYNVLYLNGAYSGQSKPAKEGVLPLCNGNLSEQGVRTCTVNMKNGTDCNSELCRNSFYVTIASANLGTSSSSAGASSGSATLACSGLAAGGTEGTSIPEPTLACSNTGTRPAGTITWNPPVAWANPAPGTYNNITATADCGDGPVTSNDCGSFTVNSSTELACTVNDKVKTGTNIISTNLNVVCRYGSGGEGPPTAIQNYTNVGGNPSNLATGIYNGIGVTAVCGSVPNFSATCAGTLTVIGLTCVEKHLYAKPGVNITGGDRPVLSCLHSNISNEGFFQGGNNWNWVVPSGATPGTIYNITATANCDGISMNTVNCGWVTAAGITCTPASTTVPKGNTVPAPALKCTDSSNATGVNYNAPSPPFTASQNLGTQYSITGTANCGSATYLNGISFNCPTITVADLPPCQFQQSWCPETDWETGIRWGEYFPDEDAGKKGNCYFWDGQYTGCNGGVVTPGDGGYYVYFNSSNNNGCWNFSGAKAKPSTCQGPVYVPPSSSSTGGGESTAIAMDDGEEKKLPEGNVSLTCGNQMYGIECYSQPYKELNIGCGTLSQWSKQYFPCHNTQLDCVIPDGEDVYCKRP